MALRTGPRGGDNWAIDLEIDAIGKHIKPKDVILDIGCANGYATFRQLQERRPSKIIGVDFSKNMIESAKQAKLEIAEKEDIFFQEGDIRNLKFDDDTFDVAYTTRVVINLPTWEEQITAINEGLRVVKPGGKFILSEGFWEPLCLLNSLRLLKQLPPLVEHDFNRYLKLSRVEQYLESESLQYEIDDFSSIYYLGSRFLRELVTDISHYEGFSNPINKIFYDIEKKFSGGGFGVQQAIIIHKK